MQSPPMRINTAETSLLGYSWRYAIPIGAGIISFILFLSMNGVDISLRILPALLLTGLGVAAAFGQINGLTPEAWLINLIRFHLRARFMLKSVMPAEAQVQVILPEAPQPETPPAATATTIALPRLMGPSLWTLSLSAVTLSLLCSLSLYLLNGGAARLLIITHGVR